MKPMTLFTLIAAGIGVTACNLVGPNPAPPTKFDETLFTIQTNLVEKVVLKTNVVVLEKEVVLYRTNEVNQIVTFTNIVPIPKYDIVTVTQQVENYSYTPKPAVTQTTTALSSLAGPIGSAIGGILVGVLTMYGRLRSSKTTGSVLVENIETIREFMKTLPDGQKYDEAIVRFMAKHQAEAGVANQVLTLLPDILQNEKAKIAASELQKALEALKK